MGVLPQTIWQITHPKLNLYKRIVTLLVPTIVNRLTSARDSQCPIRSYVLLAKRYKSGLKYLNKHSGANNPTRDAEQ